eukprot:80495-Prymnesium_polylepis.1
MSGWDNLEGKNKRTGWCARGRNTKTRNCNNPGHLARAGPRRRPPTHAARDAAQRTTDRMVHCDCDHFERRSPWNEP